MSNFQKTIHLEENGLAKILSPVKTINTLPRENFRYEWKIKWRNVALFAYIHAASIYGISLILSGRAKFITVLFEYLVGVLSGLGVTAGAHRLWSHRTFKATWQLRLLLVLMQSMSLQTHIYEWVRDHRCHHIFLDTDGDPHNSKRGFFFSHIGWLVMKKHPDVKIKGITVDMSDLEADPIIMWQKKYARILLPFLCFALPTIMPIFLWNEDPWISWYTRMLLLCTSQHMTFLVNSAAHMWGFKPYDKAISPVENMAVSIVAFGEGWHNYHHTFPWDYKAAELGNYSVNLTTCLIDFMAKIGWAYDLRTIPLEAVQKRARRTGDGTLKDPHEHKHHPNNIRGDKDMTQADKTKILVDHPKIN